MNPFFFGTASRRLYGLYQPRRMASPRNRAVVFCYPWGSEYLHAHRALRQLTKMLAAEGIHSLRFDYFGTGDSAGEATGQHLEGWLADINSAINELLDATRYAQVTLIGLRLGGTLAAAVAAKDPSRVEALVMWDPVISGAEYLEELWADHTQAPRVNGRPPPRLAEVAGAHEILGFPLTAALQAEIRVLSLAPILSELDVPTLIITSQPSSTASSLRADNGGKLGSKFETEFIPDLPPWIEREAVNAGATPTKVLKRIVQWFA